MRGLLKGIQKAGTRRKRVRPSAVSREASRALENGANGMKMARNRPRTRHQYTEQRACQAKRLKALGRLSVRLRVKV